jgi:hypothetical protein
VSMGSSAKAATCRPARTRRMGHHVWLRRTTRASRQVYVMEHPPHDDGHVDFVGPADVRCKRIKAGGVDHKPTG